MFLNYVKLAIRLLLRNPFLTFINVIGLSLGFTTFYALWEFAVSELKADQYHKDFERIVRVGVNYKWTDDGGKTWGYILMPFPLTSQFCKVQDDYPEVESSVNFLQQQNFTEQATGHGTQTLISVGDPKKHALIFNEKRIVYADSNLFNFFSIPLIHGKAENVLSEAGFVVLSQSTALKYFGETDPIGELLKLNDSVTLKVTGIFKDLPHYTHLNFDIVISNKNLHNRWKNSFENWAVSYLKLTEGSNLNSFESKLNTQAPKYFADHHRAHPQTKLDFFVQPLKDVSFSQSLPGDNFYPKSRTFLLTLAFIAISVLFMAQANYINLTLIHTMSRLKEVATRKVTGASWLDMAKQFITEAFVVTALALAVSFTLIQLIHTPAVLLFNIPIVKPSTLDPSTQFVFLLMISIGVLFSGLYPALVSSTYHPKVLFQLSKIPSRKRILPSLLTISQFSVALVFILFGFVLSHQLDYILNKAIGIKRDEIVIVEAPVVKPPHFDQNFSSFKKQLARYPEVQAVTESSSIVGDNFINNGHIKRMGADRFIGNNNLGVDENFIPFYSIRILAGRNFILDDRADITMLSRVAARRLGFENPVDAIGATIQAARGDGLKRVWKNLEVTGVFEDFRIVSFLNQEEGSSEFSSTGRGIFLMYKNKFFPALTAQKIGLKVSTTNVKGLVGNIADLFNKQFPNNVFTWYFLDDHINLVYGYEKIARNQILLFTGLAILIACMGLLGMISYKAMEKTKEIGIRKTLGAKSIHIAKLLLNTTIKHLVISVLIGAPIASYLIQQYFEKFAEHVELKWWHYSVPVFILIGIMSATIASVLWKASRSNPVDSLRYE